MVILPNGLFPFQEEAVNFLMDKTTSPTSKKTIVVKAPTGAGKTVMLISFIDEYLNIFPNTAFIWLCPGKGDLEEQSRNKMISICPNRPTKNLFDSLTAGFERGTTTFINWELVTKSGNNAIKDSERKNLFERIAEAKQSGVEFIVIIDEEHSNNTSKASAIIDAFVAKNIIRVSATTTQNKSYEYHEIDEEDVIDAGLITKAISVNEGLEDGVEADDDMLIEYAAKKREKLFEAYKVLGKNIRPLVLIQFPSGQPERIEAVEKKLENLGYTYDNGMVAKWMSEDKRDLTDDITNNDGTPIFLLMKQAINVGWDCPRAKILVKLREGGSETFQIQTVGRIRRMPEQYHYEVTELDLCYVYTFDEEYKAGLIAGVDKAYVTHRLFLKEKCKTFTLQKEFRNLDVEGMSERELYTKIRKHYVEKYKLTENKQENQQKLQEFGGYKFDKELLGRALTGTYIKTDSLTNEDAAHATTKTAVDTHKHGIYLMHSVDEIKNIVGAKAGVVKTILERLFRNVGDIKHKLLALTTSDFYAFVINNIDSIKQDFREISAEVEHEQLSLPRETKKAPFAIPIEDFFKYDMTVKGEIEYLSNAYKSYTSGYATSVVRSQPELLFERYCDEHSSNIDWVYKNGDSGQQYFSIVYFNNFRERLFYPDYIIKMKDDSVWVIEAKGGEQSGKDKNIDIQARNKFVALKAYAESQGFNWGFVRDKDGLLYFCNTEYTDELGDNWIPLKEVIK